MADQKITELTENTDPQTTDIMLIVDDPGGSPLGQKITLANLKALIGGYTEGARVQGTANVEIANDTLTALNFQSEAYDTDAIHDNTTNNTRLTCKTAGKYLIIGNVSWEADENGIRFVYIRLNGTNNIGSVRRSDLGPGNKEEMIASTIYDLDVDDYVELIVYQGSGNPMNVELDDLYSPTFMMQRIG